MPRDHQGRAHPRLCRLLREGIRIGGTSSACRGAGKDGVEKVIKSSWTEEQRCSRPASSRKGMVSREDVGTGGAAIALCSSKFPRNPAVECAYESTQEDVSRSLPGQHRLHPRRRRLCAVRFCRRRAAGVFGLGGVWGEPDHHTAGQALVVDGRRLVPSASSSRHTRKAHGPVS